MVRKIYPQLIANKIVSVQPLAAPSGLIYYLNNRYSNNKGNPAVELPNEQPIITKKPKPYQPIDAPWEPAW